ncbi:MAG: hypothetical protein L0L10_03925, partial [Tetragenococcus sp.]|nr:hypothetical protein [Tetragenococcus sp.]
TSTRGTTLLAMMSIITSYTSITPKLRWHFYQTVVKREQSKIILFFSQHEKTFCKRLLTLTMSFIPFQSIGKFSENVN